MKHQVTKTLYTLHDQINGLSRREARAFARDLVAIWDCGMHGVNTKDHDQADVTLSLAGLAKRIAEEYGLPGTFKD